MREVRARAARNWELYAGDEAVEMTAHLLPYPYTVSQAGDVTPTVQHFPDTRGRVCGTPNNILPNILTS